MELKSLSDVQGKVIELQSAILAAQSNALSANADQAAMVEEIRTLKEEIALVKAWEAQKQRYQLTQFRNGPGVVYALKESMSNSEPAHWICTKCYEEGKRMILQPATVNGFIHIVCPSCKLDISTGMRGISPPEYANG
jgi:rubrerythrin